MRAGPTFFFLGTMTRERAAWVGLTHTKTQTHKGLKEEKKETGGFLLLVRCFPLLLWAISAQRDIGGFMGSTSFRNATNSGPIFHASFVQIQLLCYTHDHGWTSYCTTLRCVLTLSDCVLSVWKTGINRRRDKNLPVLFSRSSCE